MRRLFFILILLVSLTGCDILLGTQPTPVSPRVVRPQPTQPPLPAIVEAQLTPAATLATDRDLQFRLGTPETIVDEVTEFLAGDQAEPNDAADQAPAAPLDTPAAPLDAPTSPEPTATTSLFGTPFPTRAGFPTSTPFGLSNTSP